MYAHFSRPFLFLATSSLHFAQFNILRTVFFGKILVIVQIQFVKTEKIKPFGQLTEVNILPICKQQLQTDYRCHSVRFNRHQIDQSSSCLCCGTKE